MPRNVKRVGATLAVALIQGGGKPRPYNEPDKLLFTHGYFLFFPNP